MEIKIGQTQKRLLQRPKYWNTIEELNFHYKLERLQNFCQKFFELQFGYDKAIAGFLNEIPFMRVEVYYFKESDIVATDEKNFYSPEEYIKKAKKEIREAIERYDRDGY